MKAFILTGNKVTNTTRYNQQLFYERALDMNFQIADEVRSTELAIISSYPTLKRE